MNDDIDQVKQIAKSWYDWYFSQVCSNTDDFLESDFAEEIDQMLLPWAYALWQQGMISQEEYQDIMGHAWGLWGNLVVFIRDYKLPLYKRTIQWFKLLLKN